jgi:hypothetical protein
MKNCSVDSQEVIAAYEGVHIYIDIICAISSLFFNGILTQLPESIKKCDDLAKKIELWSKPSSSDVADKIEGAPEAEGAPACSTVSADKKGGAPAWVHLAVIIDVAVFALSAMTSIAGLLALLRMSGYSSIASFASFLEKWHYDKVAGVCAGLANLIFTYASAAKDQGLAWEKLAAKTGFVTSNKEGYLLLSGDDGRPTDSLTSSEDSTQPWRHSRFFSCSKQQEVLDEESCCPQLF